MKKLIVIIIVLSLCTFAYQSVSAKSLDEASVYTHHNISSDLITFVDDGYDNFDYDDYDDSYSDFDNGYDYNYSYGAFGYDGLYSDFDMGNDSYVSDFDNSIDVGYTNNNSIDAGYTNNIGKDFKPIDDFNAFNTYNIQESFSNDQFINVP